MAHIGILLVRGVALAAGLVLILMSSLLYTTEEGAIQNRLEQWWLVLSYAEPRAVMRHSAFVAGVALLGGRVFDRLLGDKLFSARSVGVSACFSLASLGIVCSPGLSGLLNDLPALPYAFVILLLILMGVLPALAGPRLPQKLWLLGVAILTSIAFIGMDIVDWFNVPFYYRFYYALQGWGVDSIELGYYVGFVIVTIASDSLFIAATRWLLRTSSRLQSNITIVGLMLGNVSLACLLVILPAYAAWGPKAVAEIVWSGHAVRAVNFYALFSGPKGSFLATLAASNILDGLVACTFFLLLFILLLHRLVWPMMQRPVYALATRGIVRRRKLFFVLGVVLMGLGGVPAPAVSQAKKLFEEILSQ